MNVFSTCSVSSSRFRLPKNQRPVLCEPYYFMSFLLKDLFIHVRERVRKRERLRGEAEGENPQADSH